MDTLIEQRFLSPGLAIYFVFLQSMTISSIIVSDERLMFVYFVNIIICITTFLQVLSKDDPPCKTYVYRLDVPVSARWISLVVAPFEILPDHQFGLISHMCLPANLSKLRNTVEFFHGAFRFVYLVI